jgi:hypothetical protein
MPTWWQLAIAREVGLTLERYVPELSLFGAPKDLTLGRGRHHQPLCRSHLSPREICLRRWATPIREQNRHSLLAPAKQQRIAEEGGRRREQ